VVGRTAGRARRLLLGAHHRATVYAGTPPIPTLRNVALRDPPEKVFVLVQGRVVGPDDLAVGSHTLTVTVENDPTDPNVQVFTRQFFIDAAGTGVCT
jgi:hypothetical protein